MKEIKFRYVFKRKDDGHIYMIIASIDVIEEGNEHLLAMLKNEKWKMIGKDLYIGLKDKNRKEIYEGDIVEGIWINVYTGKTKKKRMVIKDIRAIPDYVECKIIGNIYENPELLR